MVGGTTGRSGDTLRHAFVAQIGRNWAVAIPVALFALAALIVPTMTRVANADDWSFASAVETLDRDGRFIAARQAQLDGDRADRVGRAFARIAGHNLGALRLTVRTAIGALVFYAILRMLGVSRNRMLGTSVLLFNPLVSPAFTFTPDPHVTAWLL